MKAPARLARKQQSSQEDWLEVWGHIQAHPDHSRAHALVEKAVERTQDATRGRSPVVGWSGGKDSLALGVVAAAAGIRDHVMVTASRELEYPAFLAWTEAHAPEGLYVEERSRLNLEWLADNPKMLFPNDSRVAGLWFQKTQHAGQREFMKRTGHSTLLMGRRTADGNYCGPVVESGARAYHDRTGFERLSPIWDWTHEDLLTVIASYGVDMPPIYWWPDGFRVGTGPWAARQGTGTLENGWAEVLSIDPSVVESAARAGIPGASEALSR